ncbi:hypothetical protein F442_13965 [Phytophthora nicotianae P10297]|uniref:ABC transmembrane type-1 domain-containing protein n=1 Tax=Phytophthora nicotianae P10297 TaxID=1317064 RepID=W2YUK2_PHYNI|nr:hypothetical protein F442_13965 [Phytophthora nicotianae P10297]
MTASADKTRPSDVPYAQLVTPRSRNSTSEPGVVLVKDATSDTKYPQATLPTLSFLDLYRFAALPDRILLVLGVTMAATTVLFSLASLWCSAKLLAHLLKQTVELIATN